MIRNHSTSAESFAACHITCGSEENLRSSGKLQLKPYFGHFSGIWITFDVRKNLDFAGNHKIKVKVKGCRNPTSIHLRALPTLQPSLIDLAKSVTRLKLKDICLQYVHSLKPPKLELKHTPQRLAFLCEKKVLLNLNEIDSSVLPPNLDMYEYSSMEKLPENSYLTPSQINFHCVVLPVNHQDSIIVSLVGQCIEQIKVEPCNHMTLNQFQNKIWIAPIKFYFHSQRF